MGKYFKTGNNTSNAIVLQYFKYQLLTNIKGFIHICSKQSVWTINLYFITELNNARMLETLNSKSLFIEVWFTNQNNKPLEIEDKGFYTYICIYIYLYKCIYIYIYIYIYLCGITIVHKRVLNYHIYRWKEQNNYAGEKWKH